MNGNREQVMTTGAEYASLPADEREALLMRQHGEARTASQRYAALLVLEAGVKAREFLPSVTKLAFRLGDGGSVVTLLTAYGVGGEVLWDLDVDEEWPDESQVADNLEAAYDADVRCFKRDGDLHCITVDW